ncbi:MAG: hypothetical protein A3F83_11370 [Candidatus Glassbacteria bacterium RIFCSPLOWO2_12_FULL_58_11]|uniref:Uncharacterized protein n=1 Tax=Candidatus Glassbacteria bacterium RIFCSPLOWO2_12_FULL_58_11 TaxID=1817867 RepID=A0A1F5YZ55_9BACT|nr:MAG: hypothetical protein A3F83_11370 [Candidatus Glassbacteria bacterium RIFCSPLOWO2_12_FULL_58_11]
MSSKKDKIIELVNSLFDIERKVVDLVLDAVPGDVRVHAQAARKEQLLALRALLDSSIKRIEDGEKKAKKGPKKVEVE